MRLVKGAEVFSSLGEKIGTLERVVIDPETDEVSHLIVKEGFLFTEDKVIPIEMVELEVGERIALKETKQDLQYLPNYEESHYVRRDQLKDGEDIDIEATYWYPPVHAWWRTSGYVAYPVPKFVIKTEKNIPEGTVALEEGAKVISVDGDHVGDIERVITEPDENRATHFVVSEGLILKHKKLIPSPWVRSVDEDEVHLNIKTDLFENLPDYYPTA